jgi:hypothetical protein
MTAVHLIMYIFILEINTFKTGVSFYDMVTIVMTCQLYICEKREGLHENIHSTLLKG